MIGFNDLLFLDEGFNLDDIVTDKNFSDEMDCKAEKIHEKPMTKLEVLKKIIDGTDLPNKQQKHVNIKGMIEGVKELPEAPKEHRKVIIFSKFNESLVSMSKWFVDQNIKYKRLGGTASQIHDIAVEFHDSYEGNNILLINGEKYASGLNLQSATDLVFMHKITDISIESQIIGRVQRLGRKYKAHIHYILYSDEMQYANFA